MYACSDGQSAATPRQMLTGSSSQRLACRPTLGCNASLRDSEHIESLHRLKAYTSRNSGGPLSAVFKHITAKMLGMGGGDDYGGMVRVHP